MTHDLKDEETERFRIREDCDFTGLVSIVTVLRTPCSEGSQILLERGLREYVCASWRSLPRIRGPGDPSIS